MSVKFHGEYPITILYNEAENHTFKIIAISPRGQWVKNEIL